MKRSVIKDLQIPAAEGRVGRAGVEPPSLLLEILVRSPWTVLTETPYRAHCETQPGNTPPAISLGVFRALRRGPRSTGPVRYRYQHLPPGPDDPRTLWTTNCRMSREPPKPTSSTALDHRSTGPGAPYHPVADWTLVGSDRRLQYLHRPGS